MRIKKIENILEKNKMPKYTRKKMYPKQEAILNSPAKFTFAICSTKSGKSYSMTQWILEQCLKKGHRSHLWIAPTREQAKDISFDLADRWLYNSPLRNDYKANKSALTIEFTNGSKIHYKSSKYPNHIYGNKYWSVVCDEMSRFEHPEEVWAAILSTTTQTNAQIKCIGNMVSNQNFFMKLYNDAKAGEFGDDASCHMINCQDALNSGLIKGLTQESIDVIKRGMLPHLFQALYYNIPSESGMCPFSQNKIYKCVDKLSNKEPVAYGIDLGKVSDKTCVIGLDSDKKVCSYHSWIGPWPLQIIKIKSIIKDTYTLMDSTGMGDAVVAGIQADCPNVEGYLFTGASKPKLIESLVMAIENEDIRYPEGEILDELTKFEYQYTKSGHVKYAAGSGHDDAVCALALANMAFGEAGKVISWDDVLVKI